MVNFKDWKYISGGKSTTKVSLMTTPDLTLIFSPPARLERLQQSQ
jgi:hypothetical protein